MNRILLAFIFSLTAFLTGIQAQTVTLYHNGEAYVFYGNEAWTTAYRAAENGDTLQLSPNNFNKLETNLSKSITVRGAGAFGKDQISTIYNLTLTGDNVVLDGIQISTLDISESQNLSVKNCFIGDLNASKNCSTLSIDQTSIKSLNCLPYITSFSIINCTIGTLIAYYDKQDRDGKIEHSVIYSGWDGHSPTATYKNNMLGQKDYNWQVKNVFTTSAKCKYYNNAIFGWYADVVVDNQAGAEMIDNKEVKASDLFDYSYYDEVYPATPKQLAWGTNGSIIGPWKEDGLTYLPNIPLIGKSLIDETTDDDGKFSFQISTKHKSFKEIVYWWGDAIDKAKTISFEEDTESFTQKLVLPGSAHNEENASRGHAYLHYYVTDADGNHSPVYSQRIKYSEGCELTYDTLDFSEDEDLLMWNYTGKDEIKDYCVYMSVDGEDYILYRADVTTKYVSFTLSKGHTYKFIVTARKNNNRRTALDEEWSVTVKK